MRRCQDLASPYDEFRVGRMGLLYQRFLNRGICAGVEWMPSTKFIECTKLKHGMIIRLADRTGSHLIRTRYLVGADGANSRAAEALELDKNLEWIVGIEEVLENVPLDGPPMFHCFLNPEIAPGYLAWAVHDGEQVHIGVGGYAARFDPLNALKKFRASLDDILDMRQARFMERRGGRIPVGGVLRRIANPKGLLVGDAAGAVSPLTAGGLDPCMRLSTFAASVIGNYLETENHESLAVYSGQLFRSRFISRLWMRRLMAGVDSTVLVEAGCALMRLPLLDSFAGHVFFGRGSFPDLNPGAPPEPLVST